MSIPRHVLTTSIPAQPTWFKGYKCFKGVKGYKSLRVEVVSGI